MMRGAIPSTVPLGVLIVTFCQPLKDMNSPYVFDLFWHSFKGNCGRGDRFPLSMSQRATRGFWVAHKREFKVRLEPRYCK
jgi:hypothetical protein